MNRQAFPSRIPIGLMIGLVVAVVALVPSVAVSRTQLGPIQAHYLKTYVRVSLLPRWKANKDQNFLLVMVSGKAGSTCAANTLLWLPSPSETLTSDDLEAASKCALMTTPLQMKSWLRGAIYDGQTCSQVLQFPLLVWAGLALLCVTIGGLCDAQRKARARRGVQMRGPELISRWQFNRRVRGDGFPIVLENEQNPLERLRGKAGKVLRIRKRDESKNIICMSDPGGGKTSILMQILDEVQRRR
jgi:hypothetical protein